MLGMNRIARMRLAALAIFAALAVGCAPATNDDEAAAISTDEQRTTDDDEKSTNESVTATNENSEVPVLGSKAGETPPTESIEKGTRPPSTGFLVQCACNQPWGTDVSQPFQICLRNDLIPYYQCPCAGGGQGWIWAQQRLGPC